MHYRLMKNYSQNLIFKLKKFNQMCAIIVVETLRVTSYRNKWKKKFKKIQKNYKIYEKNKKKKFNKINENHIFSVSS